jgi:hypothetical protein
MNQQHPDSDRTVTVAIAPNEIVAKMWQEVLRDEGIIAALKPAGAGQSFATTALVEHYVQVLGDQAERARAIIDELEADGPSSESDSDS